MPDAIEVSGISLPMHSYQQVSFFFFLSGLTYDPFITSEAL